MNISCDVIRDILPLYAENMASQATRDLVDSHLCDCESCCAELNALCHPEEVVSAEVDSLRNVTQMIKSRRLWTAVTAAMLVVTVGFWLFSFLTLLVPATYEETIESVALLDDGSLEVTYKGTASLSGALVMQSDANVALMNYTSRIDRLFPQELPQNLIGEGPKSTAVMFYSYAGADADHTQVNYWYFDDDGKSFGTLLYDAGREVPEELPWSGNSNLFGFFLIAAVAGFFWAGVTVSLRKHRRLAMTTAVLAGVCSSYVLSTLLLTGTKMTIYNSGIVSMYLIHIVILAVLLFASGACSIRLRKLMRTE